MASAENAQAPDWQLQYTKSQERLAHLLQTGIWADCDFLPGEEEAPRTLSAHRLVLAAASPVFAAMLLGPVAETTPVRIPDVSPAAFSAMLRYIYSDEVILESFEAAEELLHAAHKYMLPGLQSACCHSMCGFLTPQVACRGLELAEIYNLKLLRKAATKMIMERTTEVLSDGSFEEAIPSTVSTIFSLDKLNISSELELLHAAERYLHAAKKTVPEVSLVKNDSSACEVNKKEDCDTQKVSAVYEALHRAVQQIRFLTLSPQEFIAGAQSSPLLPTHEFMAILMNITSSESCESMPDGFSSNRRKRLPELIHRITVNTLNKFYESSTFYFQHRGWTLFMFNRERIVEIKLKCVESLKKTDSWSCRAILKLLSHKPDRKPFCVALPHIFSKNTPSSDWGPFIAPKELYDPEKEYIKDGEYTIEVCLRVESLTDKDKQLKEDDCLWKLFGVYTTGRKSRK